MYKCNNREIIDVRNKKVKKKINVIHKFIILYYDKGWH